MDASFSISLRRLLLLPATLLALTATQAYGGSVDSNNNDNVTVVPAPLFVSPDQNWDGIDGAWSTFTLRVGTPQQFVRTLVSFASYQTWVVLPQGCSAAADQGACSEQRGWTFDQNKSSSFDEIGIYDLYIERNLGYTGNAIYGYDTVGLGGQGEEGPTIKNTTVGGLAVEDFYLGVFGVNPKPTNFTSFNDPSPSYLSLLYDQGHIPSVSFGYTAGAKYRFTGVLASLTLGGYDTSKFIDNDLSFIFAADNDRDLVVAIQSITTPSKIESSPTATELLPSPVYAYIDSTVPQIWLPIDACRAFELEFGLIYDNTTQLYLVNDTLHDQLLARNANVTFQLAQGFNGGPNVQISLPYAAFDLTAQPPFQGLINATRYFPLQRAQNDTQYTLGRTFLQEAYISIHWESARFNVSQVSWVEQPEQHLVPILPSMDSGSGSGASSNGGSDKSSHGLPTGAIVGVAVGAVAGLAVLGVGVMFFWRRKKRSAQEPPDGEKSDTTSATAVASGTRSTRHVYPKAELDGTSTVPTTEQKRLLSAHGSIAPGTAPGTPRSGTSPASPGYFTYLNGAETPTTTGEGTQSSFQSGAMFSPLSATASEADSRERQVFEMPGDMPAVREKDGKALSEKEAMAHRERVYNGVDSAPNSATAVDEGVREPRRMNPDDIVRASTSLDTQDRTVHRAFSFEMDSHRELYE